MITPAAILNKYKSLEPYLIPVSKLVGDPLWVFCQNHGFTLVSRVKTLESVAEKVESGRFSRWAEIDDLVGLTIVVPTLAREPEVIDFLEKAFTKLDIKKKGATPKDPNSFRFDATRFIGRLQSPNADAMGPVHDISFEVQIKSAFEHAWSVTTHALAYKSGEVNWSRLRLTAQLKAAVEQLDTLVLAFEDAAKYIEPSDWPEIQAKADLKAFFAGVVGDGRVPAELSPKDWSRFVDNVYRLASRPRGGQQPNAVAETVMKAFEAELFALGSSSDDVPRSVSLWQLAFASLAKARSIEKSGRHWPLITPELEDLYPALRNVSQRFDYS